MSKSTDKHSAVKLLQDDPSFQEIKPHLDKLLQLSEEQAMIMIAATMKNHPEDYIEMQKQAIKIAFYCYMGFNYPGIPVSIGSSMESFKYLLNLVFSDLSHVNPEDRLHMTKLLCGYVVDVMLKGLDPKELGIELPESMNYDHNVRDKNTTIH